MPREILGGNSKRRARLHKEAVQRGRGRRGRPVDEILSQPYNTIRAEAVSLGVFKVGMTKEELAEAISQAGG